MLEDIRNRIARVFRSNTPRTEEQSRTTANQTRQDRAASVTGLQQDVRRLQQEISELSGNEESTLDSAGASVDSEQMAALHRQLTQKQQELDKYQARV